MYCECLFTECWSRQEIKKQKKIEYSAKLMQKQCQWSINVERAYE